MLLLCVTIILTSIFSTFALDYDVELETIICMDEKIYCNATIEDNFKDDCVLVILDKSISAVNKIHEKNIFSSVGFKNCIDLSAISKSSLSAADPNSMIAQIDHDNFRQIIKIELPVAGKQYVLDAINKLEQIDGIMYVGPSYYCTDEWSTLPNDTYYSSNQWGLDQIEAPKAWDITTGSNKVRVGVIDSGIATHPDLDDNVTTGWDPVNNNAITTDVINSHGTVVAGVIGAVGDNGIGICGVNWDVTLVPLQARSSTGYSDDDFVEIIKYATEHNISIINMSAGGYTDGTIKRQAIANYPGLFVCSAGNENTDTDSNIRWSASFDCKNIIAVGGSDSSDVKCSSSNYGATTVDLFAPGTGIYTTTTDNGYTTTSGTSLAAPFVTGVAALIKSIRPNLTATEIKALILNNVDKVTALDGLCVTGGRLNAYKAVRAATEAQTFTGDVNADGRSDMILSRNVGGKRALTVYLGKTTGGFEEPITTQSTRNFFYDDPAFVGDFNGDGKTDVVIHWSNGYYRQLLTYISKGDGTFYEGVNFSSTRIHEPLQLPCEFFVADVNGDNKDDFVVHYRNTNGKRSILVYRGKAASTYFIDATTDALTATDDYSFEQSVHMGDFNGDGYMDTLVHWGNESTNYKRQIRIYKGGLNGTFASGVTLSSSRDNRLDVCPAQFFVTDVDHDGKDDFVVHWKNMSGNRSNLVYKGTSASPYILDASTYALTSTNNYIEEDPVFVGDVNGDGYSDMIVHWRNNSTLKRQLLIYKANANGTYNAGVNYATSNTDDPLQFAGNYFVADVNGDGKDDFIVKWQYENNIRFLTYQGTSNGTFSAAVRTTPTTPIPYFDAS